MLDALARRLRVLPALLAPALALAAAPPGGASLSVAVDNVRNSFGRVHVDVCLEAQFLKDDCSYSADAPAHPGETTVTVHGLPPGRYAVQSFHDENANGRVDRGLLGIPKEGVGFSNDAPIRLGPPKFAAAYFDHGTAPQLIRLKLKYFIGKTGPG